MKAIIRNIALLLCAITVANSCERKPLYDDCLCLDTLSIPIDVDWDVSGIELQNVTVLIYNASDGTLAYEHTYEQNSNDIQSYISLPTGSYSAVIFNELRDQIDYVSCVDHENIETLKFESNEDTPLRSRVSTRSYIKESGDLAIAVVEGIEVTDEMIVEAAYAEADDSTDTKSLSAATKAAVESLTGVTTKRKNTVIEITAHFDNIYYARMPSLVDLVNLADGYYAYSDQNSNATSTLQFTMNNRTYDADSYYNGTISTSVTCFGTLTDRTSTSGHDDSTPITLDILFQMIDADASEQNRVMDVTSLMTQVEQADGSILITIDVDFEALDAVKPDGSSGDSGFGSTVEDWNVVDIPLIM